MKRTWIVAGIAGVLGFTAVAFGAEAAPSRATDSRQESAQASLVGSGASPLSFAVTSALVLGGAAVVALGAWRGDAAETP